MASGRVPKTVMTLIEHLIMTQGTELVASAAAQTANQIELPFSTPPRNKAPTASCVSLARDLLPVLWKVVHDSPLGRRWRYSQKGSASDCNHHHNQ